MQTEQVEPGEARIPKARELIRLLQTDVLPFAKLVAVRTQPNGSELVRLDVSPEVPSSPVEDIRMVEPFEIAFDPKDLTEPRANALRPDFPSVPHTYLRAEGEPLILCLFDEPYAEQRLRWTAAGYVRQLHTWLRKTANGTLHQSDQPVEPFLADSTAHVILPSHFFNSATLQEPQLLSLYVVQRSARPDHTLVASRDGSGGIQPGTRSIALVVDAKPQTHRKLTHQPENLSQLHQLLQPMGTDLFQVLGSRLRDEMIENPGSREARVLLILRIPGRRSDDGAPEALEVRVFGVNGSVRELSTSLGLTDDFDGHVATVIGKPLMTSESAEVRLQPFNPVQDLTPQDAQGFSGIRGAPDLHISAIGVGALGSHTLLNLARAGFGTWTVVDHDVLLPHNLVRHALPGSCLGLEKAGAIADFVNGLLEDGTTVQSICADVLTPPLADELRNALETTDVTLDFSASVAVARWLTLDAPGDSRRLSIFLNPAGTALVVMAEDRARSVRLDCIEAQYYRAVIEREQLAEHLSDEGEQVHYGHSCRDVTSTIPQEMFSLFSGIAAGALRQRIDSVKPSLAVWQSAADHSVSYQEIALAAPVWDQCEDWQISTDEALIQKLTNLRRQSLPNETGGVLLGYADQAHRLLYVVDVLPSPPDSEEWPRSYIRGCVGLKEAVDAIGRRTGNVIAYLGEWHSHPEGSTCNPSPADLEFLAWLKDHMYRDGMPALMAIVGSGGVSWHTATVPSVEDS